MIEKQNEKYPNDATSLPNNHRYNNQFDRIEKEVFMFHGDGGRFVCLCLHLPLTVNRIKCVFT